MRKSFKIGIIIIAIIMTGATGCFAGYKIAIIDFEKNIDRNIYESQTFYAEIKEIRNDNFLVAGLPINDINYRGNYNFTVTEEVKLEWRHTQIYISDLDVGDNISITFSGYITETSPAGIHQVIKIQLLNDSK